MPYFKYAGKNLKALTDEIEGQIELGAKNLKKLLE